MAKKITIHSATKGKYKCLNDIYESNDVAMFFRLLNEHPGLLIPALSYPAIEWFRKIQQLKPLEFEMMKGKS